MTSGDFAFWGPRRDFPQLVTDSNELESSTFGPGRRLQSGLLLRCVYVRRGAEERIPSSLIG